MVVPCLTETADIGRLVFSARGASQRLIRLWRRSAFGGLLLALFFFVLVATGPATETFAVLFNTLDAVLFAAPDAYFFIRIVVHTVRILYFQVGSNAARERRINLLREKEIASNFGEAPSQFLRPSARQRQKEQYRGLSIRKFSSRDMAFHSQKLSMRQ